MHACSFRLPFSEEEERINIITLFKKKKIMH